MRKIPAASTVIIAALLIAFGGCHGERKPNPSRINSLYEKVLKQYGGLDAWTFSYHPMIYAAWADKGEGRVDKLTELLLRQGNDIFWSLRANVNAQAITGAETLDRGEFLALIPDEAVKKETDNLMTKEGVPALHAFARAYIQKIIPGNPKLPDQILVLLGKLYKDHPDLLEVPVGEPSEDDESRWRDWLGEALAGCGLQGVLSVLTFDRFIDGLQTPIQEKFWDGRLSIAYNLRSIQLAKSQALDPIFQELASDRKGGQVTGLHDWMYYNLAWSLHAGGGLFPYSQSDMDKIDKFIKEGLTAGPMGDGEEAKTIADALGRAPNLQEAGRLSEMVSDSGLPCERRQLGYVGLAKMMATPVETWATDPTSLEWVGARVADLTEIGPLPCGNSPFFGFIEGALSGFTRQAGRQWPGSLFPDSDLVRIHEAFVGFLPQFTSADDRGAALYLLYNGLVQLEFMAKHPELKKYQVVFLNLYEDWSTTTQFENSKLSEDDFKILLQEFKKSLVDVTVWKNK